MSDISHIAIIMDGNRRWAKKRFLPISIGHKEGANNLIDIALFAKKKNIDFLTVYAFSTENWQREEKEIQDLMSLLDNFIDKYRNKFLEEKLKINIFGDLERFSDSIKKKIRNLIEETKDFSALTLNIALNYGSKTEIVEAVNNLIAAGKNKIEITDLEENLYSKNTPNPDLLIRTGGEKRLSNFLLWQLAYSELYFSDKLWPDFKEKDFEEALLDYSSREKRFGK